MGQGLLGQKLGVEQNVGGGCFDLMGDVSNQGLQMLLFLLNILCRYRGSGKIVGKFAFYGGEQAFIKAVFGECSLNGGIHHPVQAFQCLPGSPAIP